MGGQTLFLHLALVNSPKVFWLREFLQVGGLPTLTITLYFGNPSLQVAPSNLIDL